MAKDKDRALNPAAAQRKLEKQKALKKGKAQVAAQRNERLAHRNPARLDAQIKDLHALREHTGGKLSTRDQKQLEELERDVARIRKAREGAGDKRSANQPSNGARLDDRNGQQARTRDSKQHLAKPQENANHVILGKRRFPGSNAQDDDRAASSSETDEDVRRIPWPRDTPPPIPASNSGRSKHILTKNAENTIVPDTSLPARPETGLSSQTTSPKVTVKQAKTTYESAPQLRDLRKEAVAPAFMPVAVKKKLNAVQGRGRLLEEDEMARLEEEGYTAHAGTSNQKSRDQRSAHVTNAEADRLRLEEEAFERELASSNVIFQDNNLHATVEAVPESPGAE